MIAVHDYHACLAMYRGVNEVPILRATNINFPKEYHTDPVNDTCIGVMHIVDMYAFSMHDHVSLSLLGDNP
jgi:hypothetical protein